MEGLNSKKEIFFHKIHRALAVQRRMLLKQLIGKDECYFIHAEIPYFKGLSF
jgi:hypothetical protein